MHLKDRSRTSNRIFESSSWQRLIAIFRGNPLRRRDERRERPAPLFMEGPRAEVARGGTPSVGGPRAELKLMDKGRRSRNFRWINRTVLLCVTEVFGRSSPSIHPCRGSRGHAALFYYETWNSRRDWTKNLAQSFHERFIWRKNE